MSFEEVANDVVRLAAERHAGLAELPTIASSEAITQAMKKLPTSLAQQGMGMEATMRLLLDDVAPALAPGHAGPRYFGFVTGGVLPEALLADWLVSIFDQNVQVHLPNETISTYVDRIAVRLTAELIGLDADQWSGTITTGATASNLLGLAIGREGVCAGAAEEGLAEKGRVQVFCAQAHAGVRKVASLVGIGRKHVVDCGRTTDPAAPLQEQIRSSVEFDMDLLERRIKACTGGAIVVVGFGEVNTGALSAQIPALRALCDNYHAWLHVDAAFAAFVSLVPDLSWAASHLALADSLTTDGHKQLNLPYDVALLLTRREGSLQQVCRTGASYLGAGPLDVGIENSRRFRALPLYAALLSQGREGYAALVERNLAFAESVANYLRGDERYELLTPDCELANQDYGPKAWTGRWSTIVVLFRAHPRRCPVATYADAKTGHTALSDAIKATRKMYVTPTSVLSGRVGAIRLAVSNWATGPDDLVVIRRVLDDVMRPKAGSVA